MSSNGGSGVPIPENVLTIIREIKETTGKEHTDEDVYALLELCNMDPHDTAQKLMYLDTFQVFKSKREKKREILNSKFFQRTRYNQGRQAGGNRNFYSNNGFHAGVRNQPAQRENGGNGFPERASGPASSQQKSKDTTATVYQKKDTTATNGIKPSTGVSDPAKTPIVKEVVPAVASAAPVGPKPQPSGNPLNNTEVPNKSEKVETAEVQSLKPSVVKKTAKETNGSVKEASVPIGVITSGVASVSVEASSQSSVDSQNVIFPDHFAVSAFTNGFTFGSFGASSIDDVKPTAQPSQGSNGVTEESSPSNQAVDVADNSQPSTLVQDVSSSPNENNFTLEDPKSNTLLPTPEDPQDHAVQDGTHTFGFLSSMSSGQTVQTEGSELQSQDFSCPSDLVNGTSPAHSSPSPTPTALSSSPLSPQQIPIYRQPYPLGYMPYGHYLTPFYMPQMHQMLGHNAFAQQQPSAGNMYLPPTMAAAAAAQQGLKPPYPMYKPGTNTPVGIPSGYSAYDPTSMGYSASPAAVTSEISVNNEDLAASQLKENHIYSSAPLSEAPAAMWIPQGQDLNSLQQLNSIYNLPQGQQITDHRAFGAQQPQQTMSGVPAAETLMQQSHSGAVETARLPSGGTYQLPQMNWNSNF